jgi:hypothetical protein
MNKTPSLTDIESSAKKLRDKRDQLGDIVSFLNEGVAQLQRQALPQIKRLVAQCAENHADLTALIDSGRDLFVKPRTVIFHGIKCGLEKGKGKITIADPDKTVERIESIYPADSDFLLVITKTPNKKALATLPASDLKRLGCTIEDSGDQILIKFTDSAVDKAVAALLKDAITEATEAAA